MKNLIRRVGLWFFNLLASDIRDGQTGEVIGRAFLFAWKDKVYVIGARGNAKSKDAARSTQPLKNGSNQAPPSPTSFPANTTNSPSFRISTTSN
jgi:hypothetical protein